MNIQDKTKNQKSYQVPLISRIELDREISIQLASDADPMGEPDWASNNHQSLVPDPFKNQLG